MEEEEEEEEKLEEKAMVRSAPDGSDKKIIRFRHMKALLFSKKDHTLAKISVLGNLTHM